eukprot:gnl/MRDRNA2_/MRDRNA2_86894_c0_seq1.p1 gnl/MRDRNA2_/MRDRNA2_86894_c0~~gnl/MRDRNA2_/MRDRNA2_86894_c0_seq1.p1  ORF type:complete len:234 (-),score=37.85 gnl/MRDRNA2_/MRDRNA2_86894_c0_seq1:325-981(-)
MALQIEMGPLCSDSTHNTLKSCSSLAPQIEVGPFCSDGADSTYPTLLSSPRHAHSYDGSAENSETQTGNKFDKGSQKVCTEPERREGSQRMTAFIKAVNKTMAQPGAAPKRYVQRGKGDQGAMDRTLRMGSLIDAVRTAMQKPGAASDYIEPKNEEVSQGVTTFIKVVNMAMAQPGAAPRRYAPRSNVAQGAMDRTLSMSFLIDAVRTSIQKPVAGPK